MSHFTWIDRHGVHQELGDYQPMVDEFAAIEREINGLLPALESPIPAERDIALEKIIVHRQRLQALQADIARWNAAAAQDTQRAAADINGEIDKLAADARAVRLLINMHDEHDRLLRSAVDDPAQREAILNGPQTGAQLLLLDLVEPDARPDRMLNRGQVWDWFQGRPRFRRGLGDADIWFNWTDPDGHVHRLADPLMIERSLILIVNRLQALQPSLVQGAAPDALYAAVTRATAALHQTRRLMADLARFDREADARHLAACETFAASWRGRNNKQGEAT